MSAGGQIVFLALQVPDAFHQKVKLRAWLARVAVDHGTRIDEVNYVLMRDTDLLHYNRTFLKHDDLTDVITFPVDSNNGLAGDILISYDRVKENARLFSVSAQQELRRVMVHGLLHLCGHGDKTTAKREAMRRLEDKYLARFR